MTKKKKTKTRKVSLTVDSDVATELAAVSKLSGTSIEEVVRVILALEVRKSAKGPT